MTTSIITIVVTEQDGQPPQFNVSENVGDNLILIGILQREIEFLTEEWKAQKADEQPAN